MKHRFLRTNLILSVILTFILWGCAPPPYKTVSPLKGGVVYGLLSGNVQTIEGTPLEFIITWDDAGISGPKKILLNDQDITTEFTTSSQQVTFSGAGIIPFLQSGENTLTVENGSSVTFIYDVLGPEVFVTNVNQSGNTLEVEGYVTDYCNVESLTVEGQTVSLNNNEFTTSFSDPADFIVDFETTDCFGNTATTKIARPGIKTPALSFQATEGVVNGLAASLHASGLLDKVVAESDATPGLDLLNPVEAMDIVVADAEIDAAHVALVGLNGAPTVSFDDGIKFNAQMIDVVAALRVHTTDKIGLLPAGILMNAEMDFMGIDADVDLQINSEAKIDFDMDVSTSINTNDFTATIIDAGGFDAADILGIMIPELLAPIMIDLTNTVVGDLVKEKVNPLIQDALDGIKYDYDLPPLPGGSVLHASINPDSIVANSGVIKVNMSGGLYAKESDSQLLGYEITTSAMPEIGNTTPNGDPIEVGVILSTNFFNQALFAAYETGELATPISVEANRFGTVEAVMDFREPPVVIPSDDPSMLAGINVNGLKVDISMGEDKSDLVSLFIDANLFFNIETTINETPDGDQVALVLIFEDEPVVEIRDVTILGGIPMPNWLTNIVIEMALPQVLAKMDEVLQNIPLPSVFGLGFEVVDTWAIEDGNSPFIALAGNLVDAPGGDTPTEPEPEPEPEPADWFTIENLRNGECVSSANSFVSGGQATTFKCDAERFRDQRWEIIRINSSEYVFRMKHELRKDAGIFCIEQDLITSPMKSCNFSNDYQTYVIHSSHSNGYYKIEDDSTFRNICWTQLNSGGGNLMSSIWNCDFTEGDARKWRFRRGGVGSAINITDSNEIPIGIP